MTIAHLNNALLGWTSGYSSACIKDAEDEINQGKSYGIGALFQSLQVHNFSTIAGKLAERIQPSAVDRVSYLGLRAALLSYPFFLFAGLVKSGSISVNQLGSGFSRACGLVAEYSGDLITVAIAVGSLAMIYFGSPLYGVMSLLPLVYREIDMRGYVPREWSLFIEKNLVVLEALGLFVSHGWIFTFIAVNDLIIRFGPVVDIQNFFDRVYRKSCGIEGPTLEELEAPLVERKNLTFDEINAILDGTVQTGTQSGPLLQTSLRFESIA